MQRLQQPLWAGTTLHRPLLHRLRTFSKRMRQPWGEAEEEDADVVEEAAEWGAVGDVEA